MAENALANGQGLDLAELEGADDVTLLGLAHGTEE